MRNLRSLLIVLPLILSGCGGDSASSGITFSQPTSTVVASKRTESSGFFRFPAQRISGTVDLNGATSAEVRLLTGPSGWRIEARLNNGVVLLADADLAAADRLAIRGVTGGIDPGARPDWVWVTPLSTLIAAYRDVHPGSGQEGQLLRKVKSYLAIGPRESINRPFSSVPSSRFSPRVFIQSAGSQGVPACAASLVSEAVYLR